jgi:hypothetical protein
MHLIEVWARKKRFASRRIASGSLAGRIVAIPTRISPGSRTSPGQ